MKKEGSSERGKKEIIQGTRKGNPRVFGRDYQLINE
jgi:hypothetical protein